VILGGISVILLILGRILWDFGWDYYDSASDYCDFGDFGLVFVDSDEFG
jgi:hypothetical protein